MKNMLDIMIENLPSGAEIKNAKEHRAKYEFDFCYDGVVEHSSLFKQDASGYEVQYVKSNIAKYMACVMLERENLDEARKWLSIVHQQDEVDEAPPAPIGNENIKSWDVVYKNKLTGHLVNAATYGEDRDEALRNAKANAIIDGREDWSIEHISPSDFHVPEKYQKKYQRLPF